MQTSLRKLLAENVRIYRKHLRLTQFQLSEKMNCSPAFIGFIENSKSNVSFDTIDSLCETLRISPAALFSPIHETETENLVFNYPKETVSQLLPVLEDISLLLKKYYKYL